MDGMKMVDIKKLTKPTSLLWFIFFAVAVVFIGYRYMDSSGTKATSKGQAVVNASTVSSIKMQTVLDFIGTAVSNESVNITSTVTQKVAQINFSDCDLVKKGDVLLQLNMDKQKAILKQAEINVLEQERELARLEALKKKNVVAVKEYDAQNTRLQDAQAKLQETQEEINEGTIVAPFDGKLGLRNVSVGALLTPSTIITTIDDIKKMKVDFSVPEKYLSLIDKDCEITATSVALPNQEFHGKVLAVSPRISTISRSISVRGIIDNDDYLLKPGMMLNVTIKMQDRDAILVPEAAVFSIGEKHFVFVVGVGNKAVQTEVEIGQRQKNAVEITSGLKSGDMIVTEGAVKISDGDIVNIKTKA